MQPEGTYQAFGAMGGVSRDSEAELTARGGETLRRGPLRCGEASSSMPRAAPANPPANAIKIAPARTIQRRRDDSVGARWSQIARADVTPPPARFSSATAMAAKYRCTMYSSNRRLSHRRIPVIELGCVALVWRWMPALPSPALSSDAGDALDPSDYRALGEFRSAIRQFLAFSEQGAREHGLSSQQHQALLAIKAHPGPDPISIGELADSLLIKNHSAVELVARLVERDLVMRRDSEADRRRVLLALRPRGADILEAISRRNLARLHEGADILVDIIEAARRAAGPRV